MLGHSYGALCSLEAALLSRNIRKLVLYEPAMHITGEKIHPTGTVDRLEALLEAGDRDEVVATVMREIAGLSLEDVEVLRRLPVWQARVAAAHTIPRELRAFERYRFDPRRFRDLGVPALLLGGGESPSCMIVANETVNGALPDISHRCYAQARTRSHGHRHRPLHEASPALSYDRCVTSSCPEAANLHKSANRYEQRKDLYTM